eukprot:6180618-Pyramimonas_sp.AAC.1
MQREAKQRNAMQNSNTLQHNTKQFAMRNNAKPCKTAHRNARQGPDDGRRRGGGGAATAAT